MILNPYTKILFLLGNKKKIDDVADESQPFIWEITFGSARKPSLILFLDQTTKNMERFTFLYKISIK